MKEMMMAKVDEKEKAFDSLFGVLCGAVRSENTSLPD
jgi:hypothetical protein